MKKLSCLFWLLFPFIADAYGQDLDWVRGITAQLTSQSKLIAVDQFGNSYMVGEFNYTVDFDPGPAVHNMTSVGTGNGFVVKLDSLGNFMWAKQLGGNTYASPVTSIALDDSGQVHLAGWFVGKVDFDPGQDTFYLSTVGNNNDDSFICKLTPAGDFVWAKQVGGNARDRAQTIAVDVRQNVYFAGSLGSQVGDFDPGPGTYMLSGNPSNATDYICSLDRNGNFRWAIELENPAGVDVRDLALDDFGNLYIGGSFSDATDFDPGIGVHYLATNGGTDVFIEKLDSTANLIWVRSFGGYFFEGAKSIAIDDSNNVLLTGNFTGQVDFDPGVDTFNLAVSGNVFDPNNYKGFVSKLDEHGNFVWARKFGGNGRSQGLGIICDNFQNTYITGHFSDTVSWDPVGIGWQLDGEIQSAFLAKYGPNGNILWAGRIGGNGGIAYGLSIDLDSERNIYSTGSYGAPADLDPGPGQFILSSAGGNDRYVHKMRQCEPSLSQLFVSGCGPYVSPSGAQTWAMSGHYHDVIPTVEGCDSVMEIHFTLVAIDTAMTYASNSLAANAANASCQWLDCGNSYAIIAGATAQSFTPSMPGSYAVELTLNNCVDTSACWNLTVVGNEAEPNLNFQPVIYPNPSNGTFAIVLPKGSLAVRVQILDLQGRTVLDQKVSDSGSIPIRLMQAPGAYCLNVMYSDGRLARKMLLIR